MVICNCKDEHCRSECPHSIPHDPIYDRYDIEDEYCDKSEGVCGYKVDMPLCKCEEITLKRV